ncbi:hypothetical protein EBB07_29045 [Paenibacillaceae bacterium]|nr:hypothetical protein EBB07_29045 [Paenibacillaceae bacterium]
MTDDIYIYYYFYNPAFVLIFCVCVLILFGFILHLIYGDELDESYLALVAAGLLLTIGSFVISYVSFAKEEREIRIIPSVNITISKIMLITLVLIILVCISRLIYSNILKNLKHKNREKNMLVQLKDKYIQAQNTIFTLGESYTGVTKSELSKLQYLFGELKGDVDAVSLQEDIKQAVAEVNGKLDELMQNVWIALEKERDVHEYLNNANSRYLNGDMCKEQIRHYEYIRSFAAIDFFKAYQYIKFNGLNKTF